MTTFLLLPFLAYSLTELRSARRREQRLWAVLEEMADRVDDVSHRVGLLPPGDRMPPGRPTGATPEASPSRPALRVVNGGR